MGNFYREMEADLAEDPRYTMSPDAPGYLLAVREYDADSQSSIAPQPWHLPAALGYIANLPRQRVPEG